ncbi:MAG: VWA domain-containing protein, partial [Planctomycetota bacterium]
DQIFYNPFPTQMEGHYLFPLPADANVNQFSMWMNGIEVHAEILESAQATQIYQSIVSRRRDPGLLELVGTQLLKVHVFPILPQADTRIKLSYTYTLQSDSNMMEVFYPINTSKFINFPVEQCSVLVKIKNQKGLATVYSPTHDMDIQKKSDHEAVASWEKANHTPLNHFKLYITESDKNVGIHGLMHRLPGEEGYFMMMLSPKQEDMREIPKDVVFVIDTSGSMAGVKMTQTRDALTYCVSKLKPQDRFNIVPFSTEARFFAESLQEANEANLSRAQIYIEKLLPRGGTNIDEGLQLGLNMMKSDRLGIVLFLTDGLPTIGERNVDNILKNVKTANKASASIFAFGAGNEINTSLLDKLASENNGAQEYVAENEDIKVKIARFFDKLSSPVMTDVRVNFVGFHPTDVYPKKLSNLFKGSQLLITGRYASTGSQAIQLIGKIEGKEVVLTDELSFTEVEKTNDFIPRIWANRKVGYLMEEIRMHGVNNELKQEIIRLGKTFGIVTPYTSFLAVEESELSNLPGDVRRQMNEENRPAAPMEALKKSVRDFEGATEGKDAIAQSKSGSLKRETASMEDMDKQNESDDGAVSSDPMKMIGSKTFIKRGNTWVDSTLPADKKEALLKIVAFSKEYFELIQKNADVAKYLSIGANIIFVFEGQYYHIVSE